MYFVAKYEEVHPKHRKGGLRAFTQSWRIVVESVGSSCDDSESRFDLSQDLTLVSPVGF